MSKNITEIQKKILEFVMDRRARGILPTLAEIASEFGYKNRATVQQHLAALEKKGYLKRNPKVSRGIELTVEDKFFLTRPILGEVAAGNPLVMYPDSLDSVELPTIVRMPYDSFLLRVKGDSLKDAYIFSGDIIIVNPNVAPLNGHIVVVLLNNEALVKRFYKKKGLVELHSENPEYKPIVIEKGYSGFKVVGVVVGVYRSMERRN